MLIWTYRPSKLNGTSCCIECQWAVQNTKNIMCILQKRTAQKEGSNLPARQAEYFISVTTV